MENNRFNNNIRVLVEEAGAPNPSPRWQEAVNETAMIHTSLPKIIDQAARHMPGTSSDPKDNAFRIGDAALREVASSGREKLDDLQEMILARRVFRSVLVQEAASHIMKERNPSQSMDSFMGLKATLGENNNSMGLQSLSVLKQSANFDMREAVQGMDDKELRALSTGSFDRLKPKTSEMLSKVLEVSPAELGDRYPATSIGRDVSVAPYVRHPRTQMRSPERVMGFGRKMTAQHHMAQAHSMAM